MTTPLSGYDGGHDALVACSGLVCGLHWARAALLTLAFTEFFVLAENAGSPLGAEEVLPSILFN
jgi:hypothetical protein